jgi:hypothetical protein
MIKSVPALPFNDPSVGVIFQSPGVSDVNLARKSAKPINEFYRLKQARGVSEFCVSYTKGCGLLSPTHASAGVRRLVHQRTLWLNS